MKPENLVHFAILVGLTTLWGCRRTSDCDPESFAELCLPDGKVRICDSVQHWLPEPYVTWNVKEYACKDSKECVGSEDKKDAGCVQIKPDACPADFNGRACVDGTAIHCDPGAPGGRWLIALCYRDYVCNSVFEDYPACVSPYMTLSEANPEFEAWLESHKAAKSVEDDAGRTSD